MFIDNKIKTNKQIAKEAMQTEAGNSEKKMGIVQRVYAKFITKGTCVFSHRFGYMYVCLKRTIHVYLYTLIPRFTQIPRMCMNILRVFQGLVIIIRC